MLERIGGSPPSPEKTPEKENIETFMPLSSAKNFLDLYELLDERGGITYSDGTFVPAQTIIENIHKFLDGNEESDIFTRKEDLRNTILRLKNEQIKAEKTKEQEIKDGISACKNLDELSRYVRSLHLILPEIYEYDDVRQIGIAIDDYLEYRDIDLIPEKFGVRTKVLELAGVKENKGEDITRGVSASKNILKESPIIKELWPKGLDQRMMQGGSGDCYFLAALQAIKTNPNTAVFLTKMLEKNNDGTWSVFYRVDGQEKRYIISNIDLLEMRIFGKSITSGSKGDRILERSYARLIKRINDQSSNERSERFDTRRNTVIAGQMDFEGGHSTLVFEHFFGKDNIISYHEHNPDSIIGALISANEKSIFCAYTFDPEKLLSNLLNLSPEKRKLWVKDDDFKRLQVDISKKRSKDSFARISYFVETLDGGEVSFPALHAYAVGQINKKEQWVEITNPHDTKKKSFKISFDEFKRKFPHLAVGRLR